MVKVSAQELQANNDFISIKYATETQVFADWLRQPEKYKIIIYEAWDTTTCPKICDAQRDLVPFVKFKELEKHLWMGVTFSKVKGNFTTSSSPPLVFFHVFCIIQIVPNCGKHHIQRHAMWKRKVKSKVRQKARQSLD